jgi:hypothetical protein
VGRPSLALVAAFLVVAIVAGALIGGRLIRDWNNFVNPPVPGGHSSVFQKQLSDLETRHFRLSTVGPKALCPAGPFNPTTGWWGGGPVYLSSNITVGLGGSTITAWGLYVTFDAFTDPTLRGPVLFRAEDLRTGRPILFVGAYGVGESAGTDVVNGAASAQYSELALDASRPPKVQSEGYFEWTFQAGVFLTAADRALIGAPAGAGQPFCVGWQVDGAGISETFVLGI